MRVIFHSIKSKPLIIELKKRSMQTKKPNQEEAIKKLSLKQALKIVKRDQYHDLANEKMKELTLGYFREAKDNVREKEAIFKRYKKEWVKFCVSMNATQKYVQLIPSSFKARVDLLSWL